ncbi:hypothetical protein [Thermogymnomonas acidicola]|uniref:hypothetical protein n=1 Tax=Thermogymnomonas acidicola TaxID=399579 RepID=UPI0009462551|nr:hypothetical protein [Thermogymnomonas acidicola]
MTPKSHPILFSTDDLTRRCSPCSPARGLPSMPVKKWNLVRSSEGLIESATLAIHDFERSYGKLRTPCAR